MDKFFDKAGKLIIRNKFLILFVFIFAVVGSVFLANSVKINEDMTKYMPSDSNVAQAIEINTEEFGNNETLKVMIKDVSRDDINQYKTVILNIDSVLKISEESYKNNHVLFSVTLKSNLSLTQQKSAVDDIRSALSNKMIALEGHIVTENYVDKISSGEASKLLMVIIPVLLLILFLSSKSFIDPVICLIVIAVSILIGTGTNAMFTDVSSITNNMFSVLMIAISMDYSIFMLHTFKEERERGLESKDAVLAALKKSFTTITSASLTTIAGFIAMVFMKFAFGADIGWVFAKGILISLLTAILLMPCLLLIFDKVIRKTSHREFLPSFKGIGKGVMKIRWGIIPTVLVLITLGVIGSQKNNFIYGNSTLTETPGTPLYDDSHAIVDNFGRKNNLVILMPKGENLLAEESLAIFLSKVDNVSEDVISLAMIVKTINPALLSADLGTVYATLQAIPGLSDQFDISEFHSKNYARIILNLETPEESDAAFKAIEDIREICPEGVFLLGSTSVALEMKEIIDADYLLVTFLSILAIALIIGFTFKSGILPIILVLCVEGGVFINMAVPALSGQAIPYVAYLLISTIQLGATIDYAILLTSKYMANRKSMRKKEAAIMAVHQASGSILTSGGILTAAGFAMYFTSADKVVAQMGMLLGRGALISIILAFTFLPAMLIALDKVIQKTTFKTQFLPEDNLLDSSLMKGENNG